MKLTYLMILAIIAAFMFTQTGAVFDRFGFSGSNLMSHPETLVTSIFLHGSIEHLLSNIIVLLFVGLAVQFDFVDHGAHYNKLAWFFKTKKIGASHEPDSIGFRTISFALKLSLSVLLAVRPARSPSPPRSQC